MIVSILAALDGSLRAPAVFNAAAGLAEAFRARLYLLRVVDLPPEYPPAAHVAHPDRLVEVARANAERDLMTLARARADLVTSYAVVQAAEPWRAILDSAHSFSADILVIGTHGRRGLERILGTTASRIISHADRNLFIVHPT